ncbi:MAG: hypothetical protein P8Y93_04455 [Acidobacteriota bacterium]
MDVSEPIGAITTGSSPTQAGGAAVLATDIVTELTRRAAPPAKASAKAVALDGSRDRRELEAPVRRPHFGCG